MVLEKVRIDLLCKVSGLAAQSHREVDLVRHEGDARSVEAQVQVRVKQVRREQPAQFSLVDLRCCHRVLRVRLECAVELGEEVAARVEEEDIIVHEQRVLGTHERHCLQPRLERIAERADWHQSHALAKQASRFLELGGILVGVLPQRLRECVEHPYALRQRIRQMAQLCYRRRDGVLRADNDRDVRGEHRVLDQRVARLDGSRNCRREWVARQSLDELPRPYDARHEHDQHTAQHSFVVPHSSPRKRSFRSCER